MAADLHIHSMLGVTEDDLACFFSNHLGSRWCTLGQPTETEHHRKSSLCDHWQAVSKSPNVWVGEVSWLKAALLEDDRFVPEPVQAVNDLIGEHLPVLDKDLKEKILAAANVPNERATRYETTSDLGAWLYQHMGERLFTVSW